MKVNLRLAELNSFKWYSLELQDMYESMQLDDVYDNSLIEVDLFVIDMSVELAYLKKDIGNIDMVLYLIEFIILEGFEDPDNYDHDIIDEFMSYNATPFKEYLPPNDTGLFIRDKLILIYNTIVNMRKVAEDHNIIFIGWDREGKTACLAKL